MLTITLLAHAALLARLTAPVQYPFAVGEILEYEAKLGVIPIGTARMTVNPMTRERGAEAFVFAATGAGRPMGIRANHSRKSGSWRAIWPKDQPA